MLALLTEVRDQLQDPLAAECAILFHDAIYEPTRTDNEQRNAAVARKMLAGVIADDVLRRTARLIDATDRHLVPDNLTAEEAEDCRIFLAWTSQS